MIRISFWYFEANPLMLYVYVKNLLTQNSSKEKVLKWTKGVEAGSQNEIKRVEIYDVISVRR